MANPETTAREIVVEALRRMSKAGESHEMAARWILEDLYREGYLMTYPIQDRSDAQHFAAIIKLAEHIK